MKIAVCSVAPRSNHYRTYVNFLASRGHDVTVITNTNDVVVPVDVVRVGDHRDVVAPARQEVDVRPVVITSGGDATDGYLHQATSRATLAAIAPRLSSSGRFGRQPSAAKADGSPIDTVATAPGSSTLSSMRRCHTREARSTSSPIDTPWPEHTLYAVPAAPRDDSTTSARATSSTSTKSRTEAASRRNTCAVPPRGTARA